MQQVGQGRRADLGFLCGLWAPAQSRETRWPGLGDVTGHTVDIFNDDCKVTPRGALNLGRRGIVWDTLYEKCTKRPYLCSLPFPGPLREAFGAIEAAGRRLPPPLHDPKRGLQQAPFLVVTPPSSRASIIMLNSTESAILARRKSLGSW